jgi:hypothetical protein
MQNMVTDNRLDGGQASLDPSITSSSSSSPMMRPLQLEKEISDALASLQLPHMPESSRGQSKKLSCDSSSAQQQQQRDPPPTIRILVCADLDLNSTSDLAEYILQQKHFDATLIDLIIAAGPFSRHDDLAQYSSGRRYRPKSIQPHRRPVHSSLRENSDNISRLIPFFHTREETAALEGLMTAALSQLESIVCRVVYCPGYSDPLTTVTTANKRLTPNSRNIHRQWLPLAPGLGCAGMFYIDGADKLMSLGNTPSSIHPPQGTTAPPAVPATSAATAAATAAYEAEDESSEEEDSMVIFSEHWNQMRQRSVRFHGFSFSRCKRAFTHLPFLFFLQITMRYQKKSRARTAHLVIAIRYRNW